MSCKSCGSSAPCGCKKPCGCPTSVISCGCSGSSSAKPFGTQCCKVPVQPAPAPCCEPHTVECVAGVCLNPVCDVVASAEDFFLSFSNLCQALPVDSNNIFFFHPAAGVMQVVQFDGCTYKVRLVDPTRAGGLIQKGDCVLISVIPESVIANTTQRCLCGKFVAPQLNQNETLFIENGAGIPIGATVVFTYQGETGSYVVTAFVSSSGNTFAYEVQNTGNGHTPGTIIDGGDVGQCLVPIDIITEVDLCDLAETNVADLVVACVNGSPRAFKPVGACDIIKGKDDGTWELGKITSVDCCVVLDGCLKFSGNVCPNGQDVVVIKDTNKDCFEAAWQEVLDQQITSNTAQMSMPMNIDGFRLDVRDYDPNTCQVTFAVADPDALINPIEFDEGTQVCLGDCCESCLNGPLTTNHKSFGEGDEEKSALYTLNLAPDSLEFETGVKHCYLIGYEYGENNPLVLTTLVITDAYDDDPNGGPGKPLITDPLLFRDKMCNDQLQGCDQMIELNWNYEFAVDPIPAGVRVHFEFGHFVQGAETLADNVTPNPIFSTSSQACAASYIDGPSSLDAQTRIGDTSIGLGNRNDPKIFPMQCGFFMDYAFLQKCNCIMSVVWLYVETEVLPGFDESGTFTMWGTIRRRAKYFNAHEIAIVPNDQEAQGWNT